MGFAAKVLHKQVFIRPSLDAAQWSLYTDMLPRVDEAARNLNLALQGMVNDGSTRERTRAHVLGVMCEYADVGANDTEPRCILEDLLDEIYGG